MKGSFLLHIDSLNILDKMSNEQAGELFKAIKYYHEVGTLPEIDLLMQIAIMPFINQFKRDEEKYNNVVERNKKNGKKGGRPSNNQEDKPKKPSGLFGNPKKPKETQDNPKKPKKPDNDNDNDNVSDSVNDNDNVKELFPGEVSPVVVVSDGKIWNKCIEAWFTFYGEHFTTENNEPAKPKFGKVELGNLKTIFTAIKNGTLEKKQKEWNEANAYDNCMLFFKRAFEKSEWLRQHFELKNLATEYNSITNQSIKSSTNGKEYSNNVKGNGIKVKRNNFGQ